MLGKVIIIIPFCLSLKSTIIVGETCIKDKGSLCKCTNSKGAIDLIPLASRTGQPRFDRIPATLDTDKNTYSFNPCVLFNEGSCKDVLGCQMAPDGKGYFPIADSKEENFNVTGSLETSDLQFHYSAELDQVRYMIVNLECTSDDGILVVDGEIRTRHYVMHLKSRYACYNGEYPGGISAGSVLLIIFFLLVLIYFIGGFLFLTFARGATGRERFPNYEFWSDFPHLVRDGACFVKNGCKTEAGYDQI